RPHVRGGRPDPHGLRHQRDRDPDRPAQWRYDGDAGPVDGSRPAAARAPRAPDRPVASSSHSLVALTPAPAGAHRLVLWAVAPSLATGSRGAADALIAVVRALAGRPMPALAFVVFDPRGDTPANATAVRATLGSTIID